MAKKIISLAIVGLLGSTLLFATSALAVKPTPSPLQMQPANPVTPTTPPQTPPGQVVRPQVSPLSSEDQQALSETERENRRQELFSRALVRINNRLSAALDRMERLLVRVDTLIKKFEERGRDMTEVKTRADEAKMAIEAARETVGALLSTDAAMTPQDIKAKIGPAIEAIKTAREAVVLVLKTFRASIKLPSEGQQ